MQLLPFERITLRSSRSADDLIAALKRITRPFPPPVWQFVRSPPGESPTPLVGDVSRERLYVRQDLNRRNSFAPYLMGRIVEAPTGARIEATLRLHNSVLAFVGFWIAIVGPLAVLGASELIRNGEPSGPGWIPIAMLAAMYAACMLGFLPEARRMKRLLREIAGEREVR
jgi:hypothetical protein